MIIDFARRAHDHNWELDPITRSLLDTDFYKLLMLQFIWKHFPRTHASFTLINRTASVRLGEIVAIDLLREQLEATRKLQFRKSELIWLAGNTFYGRRGIFEPAFLAWLEHDFRLSDYELAVEDAQISLRFHGLWSETTMWEIYALSTIAELKTRASLKQLGELELDLLYARAKTKLWEKMARLRGVPDLSVSDFGTRRRHSFRYWARDAAAERAAQKAVAAAGFADTLRSEPQVGFFLANVLPRWRDQWEIVLGDRLRTFLANCEIIAPEVAVRPAGNDWLAVDIAFKNGRGETPLTSVEVRQLLQKGVSHQRLANGRIALVPTEAMQEFQEVIFDCDAQQSGSGLKVPKRFGAYLTEAVRENKWQPPTTVAPPPDLALPGDLSKRLRPYQHAGVNWLQHLGANGLGGILADEMGLGKTIQALAWLAARQAGKPSLVVCPTSLVTNWQAEAARFTPGLKTLLLHGPARQARFADVAAHDLVITSYALLRRDGEQYAQWEFDSVILDEAQHIKNRFSQNAQAVKTLRAAHRFVLTGTPMENSLDDLWSIFDFLMPGYLGAAKEFKDRYEMPIAKAGDAAALRRLRQRLRPFVLRRTKAEVAPELPARIEQVAWCEMSQEQQTVYQAILDQGRREVFEHAGKGGEAKQRMAVLTTLTRLRQACCHLDLLPAREGKPWNEPSAKLDLCLELIEEARGGGHRVLVFSQFVKMLRLLESALREQETAYCYLDGATVDRQGEVRRFQESPDIPVFLISLKAGGTGLNLTGADTVIHFDPWWNPAVEEQATARAHRIGQTSIVTSCKLIAQGSVEEKIVKLQEKKKELIANTLATDEAFMQSLTWDELQGLLE